MDRERVGASRVEHLGTRAGDRTEPTRSARRRCHAAAAVAGAGACGLVVLLALLDTPTEWNPDPHPVLVRVQGAALALHALVVAVALTAARGLARSDVVWVDRAHRGYTVARLATLLLGTVLLVGGAAVGGGPALGVVAVVVELGAAAVALVLLGGAFAEGRA